jgi:DNA mismatch endonuclease (patch repair protein)
MVDVVEKAVRSRMMAGIRGADTEPELAIRKGLHARGFRFRLHDRSLPGNPDLVLQKYKAVIFVHGCFWHMHQCHLFKWPSTRPDFWRSKISGNRERDLRAVDALHQRGWRILIVWECAMKGRERFAPGVLIDKIAEWLLSCDPYGEIPSRRDC